MAITLGQFSLASANGSDSELSLLQRRIQDHDNKRLQYSNNNHAIDSIIETTSYYNELAGKADNDTKIKDSRNVNQSNKMDTEKKNLPSTTPRNSVNETVSTCVLIPDAIVAGDEFIKSPNVEQKNNNLNQAPKNISHESLEKPDTLMLSLNETHEHNIALLTTSSNYPESIVSTVSSLTDFDSYDGDRMNSISRDLTMYNKKWKHSHISFEDHQEIEGIFNSNNSHNTNGPTQFSERKVNLFDPKIQKFIALNADISAIRRSILEKNCLFQSQFKSLQTNKNNRSILKNKNYCSFFHNSNTNERKLDNIKLTVIPAKKPDMIENFLSSVKSPPTKSNIYASKYRSLPGPKLPPNLVDCTIISSNKCHPFLISSKSKMNKQNVNRNNYTSVTSDAKGDTNTRVVAWQVKRELCFSNSVVCTVGEIIMGSIVDHLTGFQYQQAETMKVGQCVAEEVSKRIREVFHLVRYRIVAVSTLMQIAGQGSSVHSNLLRDSTTDMVISRQYESQNCFMITTVFLIEKS